MDIRRTLLWIVFTFSLLLLWNNWQVHNGQPSLLGGGPTQTASTQAPDNGSQAGQNTGATNGAGNVPEGVPAGNQAAAAENVPEQTTQAEQGTQGELISVTTDVYSLTFNTQGAQLVKAQLLDFIGFEGEDSPMMLLDNSPTSIYVAQTGVVGAPSGTQFPTHLTPFRMVSTQTSLTGDHLDVVFEAESGNLKVTKTYRLDKGSYNIHVRHDVENLSDQPVKPSIYLQLTRDGNDPPDTSFFYNTFTGPAVYSEQEKYQKIDFSDIQDNKAKYVKQADTGWIAMVQHYFASAWVPTEGQTRYNEALRVGNNLFSIRAIEPIGTVAPGETATAQAQLWVGPQDQGAMEKVAPGLNVVVDYGFLTIIAKPLFELMTWIHSFVGNWGWTIVLLTLLIKLVFYPLSAASYRSMAKMKQVTPRLQALREKFGDDRAKLNQAMMEMYRTEKINPLGGCLPMVVQIPVFIALYWVLLGSVEMRGAPWILWIHDLSARDPWFILPAIMMGTMFLQIKLNPTPPDPMQARIMMLMPLIFGGMMFFFPAGLVLYWCVNNIISIAQQRYIMHKLEKQKVQAQR
ncbi:MAG TPA: membrane protein insertase YidC [Pusillimonas sp.]|jgi:YidC/Oxa1 family membrane protein insertase|nr:membrane protein insertase YidC [Pusillimonas sp.]|tara:strand:- start:35123 stop:36838 length:1716 start_codon:yes stop_codon:yes gene_type:complete